ncbi:hypothetical protein BC938DRAFT_481414 [Jimgerdemannia flammicorona]|uniref:Uncharacterized protein n=1 Tax=Jimgerdemannia flammicorona TaxID=994334 RepID=A0A433QG77_9FUNG|nr:hypothetical protein BC938DRAFT_481414 [Jimgerdemannia flammicorona]
MASGTPPRAPMVLDDAVTPDSLHLAYGSHDELAESPADVLYYDERGVLPRGWGEPVLLNIDWM